MVAAQKGSQSKQMKLAQKDLMASILECNKKLLNFRFTDKVLRTLYKIEQSDQAFIQTIFENFDFGAKSTVTLIP